MDGNSETVLDYIDNIKVPGDPFKEPANEYWMLVCLRRGLELLYSKAYKFDEAARKNVNPKGNLKVFGFNVQTGINSVQLSLLTCAYHWYAISACNYARIVGEIAKQQDESRPSVSKYVEKCMPEVLAFRDKVAAHPAWASGNKKDNDAEQLASVIPQVQWSGDSYKVGSFRLGIRKSGQSSDSSAIKPWSLVEVHEQLRKRFWIKPNEGPGDDI